MNIVQSPMAVVNDEIVVYIPERYRKIVPRTREHLKAAHSIRTKEEAAGVTIEQQQQQQCCINRKYGCPKKKISFLRDSDFELVYKEYRCSSKERCVFICASDHFKRLALKHDACNNCIGVLIPSKLIRRMNFCACIHDCLSISERNQSFTPIWNLCLAQFNIYVEMENERKKKGAINHVKWMAAVLAPSINAQLSHLVCDNSSNDSYRTAAILFRIKNIVQPTWITNCWQTGNSKINDDHLFKMFSGLKISLLTFEPCEKEEAEKYIEREGATCVQNAQCKCTHVVIKDVNRLVANELANNAYHIHDYIVSSEWLEQCCVFGGRVEELPYLIKYQNDCDENDNGDMATIAQQSFANHSGQGDAFTATSNIIVDSSETMTKPIINTLFLPSSICVSSSSSDRVKFLMPAASSPLTVDHDASKRLSAAAAASFTNVVNIGFTSTYANIISQSSSTTTTPDNNLNVSGVLISAASAANNLSANACLNVSANISANTSGVSADASRTSMETARTTTAAKQQSTPASSSSSCKSIRKRGFLATINSALSPRNSGNKSIACRRNSSRLTLSPKRSKKSSSSPKNDQSKHEQQQARTQKRIAERRMYRIEELHQTECNYIAILDVMIEFKRKLTDDPILSPAEANQVLGKVERIRTLHNSIRKEIEEVLDERNFDYPIGNIFSNKENDFTKAYTPYVNSMEDIRAKILHLKETNYNFNEFLTKLESSTCSRENFTDLLIRPVQRLASLIVLLNSLLDVTPIGHVDHDALEEAVDIVKKVAASVNQSKEVVEGARLVLCTVNDIAGCPANVCSQHRRLLYELKIKELTDEIFARECTLAMFVFTDCIELARLKRRTTSKLSTFRESLMPLSTPSKALSSSHSECKQVQHNKTRRRFQHVYLLNMLQITNIHLFDPYVKQSIDDGTNETGNNSQNSNNKQKFTLCSNDSHCCSISSESTTVPALMISFIDDISSNTSSNLRSSSSSSAGHDERAAAAAAAAADNLSIDTTSSAECTTIERKLRTFAFQITQAKSIGTQRLSFYNESKESLIKMTKTLMDTIVKKIVEMKCLKDHEAIDELTQTPFRQVKMRSKNWRRTLGKQISHVLTFEKSKRNH